MKAGAEKRKREEYETAQEVDKFEDPNGPTFDPTDIVNEPDFEPTPEFEEFTEEQKSFLKEKKFEDEDIEMLEDYKIPYDTIMEEYDNISKMNQDISLKALKALKDETMHKLLPQDNNQYAFIYEYGGTRRKNKRKKTKRRITRRTRRRTRRTRRRTRRTRRRR